MTLRRAVAAAVAATSLVAGVALAGADAAEAQSPTGNTTVTFTITAGGLSITVPASANLGSVGSGAAEVSGQLGTVTVTDNRGALVGNWTTTVSSTAFTTGGGTPSETIPNTLVVYSPPLVPTVTRGTGVAAGVTGPLALPLPSVTYVGVGSNTVTWNPTLTVPLLAQYPSGTYTGTVTHSVA